MALQEHFPTAFGSQEVAYTYFPYHVEKTDLLADRASNASAAGRDFWHPKLSLWWSTSIQAPVKVLAEGGDTPNLAQTFGSPFKDLPGNPAELDLVAYSYDAHEQPTTAELLEQWGMNATAPS